MLELGRHETGQVLACHDPDYMLALEARYCELLRAHAGELARPEAAAAAKIGGVSRAGAIMVIPVFGALVQHPSWLTYYGLATSTDQLRAEIAAAQADPNVSGVLLRINSGGGQVVGLVGLAALLRSIRGSFPVWGHADSCALSAAQWVLASCGRAYVTPLGSAGSIGVVYEHRSLAKADELAGVKRTLVRFPDRKAETWAGSDLDEAARARIEAQATLAYGAFVADVAKGRGVGVETVRSDEWGRGAILDGAEAARVGLVDGVQGFEETLQQLARAIRSGKATEAPKGARAGQGEDPEEEDPEDDDLEPATPAPEPEKPAAAARGELLRQQLV